MAQSDGSGKGPAVWAAVSVLLGVAVAGALWVPVYARMGPRLGPVPFFYWFQLAWVGVTAALCWVCYLLLRTRPGGPGGPGGPSGPGGPGAGGPVGGGRLCMWWWFRL
jgi:hypothetical protein